jgi:hypothetical protein
MFFSRSWMTGKELSHHDGYRSPLPQLLGLNADEEGIMEALPTSSTTPSCQG